MTSTQQAWVLSLAIHLVVGMVGVPIVIARLDSALTPLQVRIGPTMQPLSTRPTTVASSPPLPAAIGEPRPSAPIKAVQDVIVDVPEEAPVPGSEKVRAADDAAVPLSGDQNLVSDRRDDMSVAAVDVPVDLSIVCHQRPAPAYPAAARRRGDEGKVVLAIQLDQRGLISVSVASSSGSRWLDEAAVQAVRTWRCDPAMQAGRTVQATALQTFSFVLQGG